MTTITIQKENQYSLHAGRSNVEAFYVVWRVLLYSHKGRTGEEKSSCCYGSKTFWWQRTKNVCYKVISNCFKLWSNSGSFHSLNVSGLESESLTVSRTLENKRKLFCCVHKFLIVVQLLSTKIVHFYDKSMKLCQITTSPKTNTFGYGAKPNSTLDTSAAQALKWPTWKRGSQWKCF